MTEDSYRRIVERLERWSCLGAQNIPNGARLIGHIPHVAPLAYLHQIYPGLTEPQVNELAGTVGRPIPDHHRAFLRLGNGMSLFMQVSFYGLRFTYSRDPDASRLPFHMKTSNTWERPKGAPDAAVFVGGYSYDGSELYVLPGDPRVYHCPRRAAKPVLNTWPSLEAMLNAEIDRFETLLDRDGKLIDPGQPTMPPAGTYR